MKPTYSEQDIRDRLSISTLVFRGHQPVSIRTLSELAENGIRRIEILESPGQFDLTRADSMDHVVRDCRETGVEIIAYHASETHFADIEGPEKRRETLDRCKRQIDTMLGAGAKIWGSHIRGIDARGEDCLRELLQFVEGSDAVIVLENFPRDPVHVEDRVETLIRLDHPQLGMLLDIGHVRNAKGENPMTLPGGPSGVLDLCGSKLRHLHLHGFVDRDHYPPFYEGDRIQWAELFQKLHDIGYPGFFNFEPRGRVSFDNTLELTGYAPAVIAKELRQ